MFFHCFSFFLSEALQSLQQYSSKLRSQAYAENSRKTMRSQLKAYMLFCEHFNIRPFPVTSDKCQLYIVFLTKSLTSYGSLCNYLSVLVHANLSLGYDKNFMSNYQVQLMKRASRRVLGDNPNRKSPITINMLIGIYHLLDLSRPFHAVVWALLLVAFFFLLRKSNLLPATYQQVMNKDSPHLRHCNIHFNAKEVILSVYKTKTIQFKQCVLTIPLPRVHNSILCPTQALHNYSHMVPAPGNFPVFLIKDSCSFFQPLLSSHFARVIKTLVSMLNLDTKVYSPHSFRRGGATFAFHAGAHHLFIKCLGDWSSDAYLIYLTLSNEDKVTVMQLASKTSRRP